MNAMIKELKKKLYTDRLTGIYNANFIDDCFNNYLHENNSYILIDIDNFKVYNTIHGYEGADKILTSFTSLMKKLNPLNKTLVRFKFGDEFLIILPGQTKEQALLFLNGLRENLRNTKALPVQFSAGVASFTKSDTQASVFLKLMSALSEAKKEKNISILYESGV